MSMRAKPDSARVDLQTKSVEEVASVFQTAEYRVFAKAIGLKNALRAGFAPNLDIVTELHEALWKALMTADEEQGLGDEVARRSPPDPGHEGHDPRDLQAVRGGLRGAWRAQARALTETR